MPLTMDSTYGMGGTKCTSLELYTLNSFCNRTGRTTIRLWAYLDRHRADDIKQVINALYKFVRDYGRKAQERGDMHTFRKAMAWRHQEFTTDFCSAGGNHSLCDFQKVFKLKQKSKAYRKAVMIKQLRSII